MTPEQKVQLKSALGVMLSQGISEVVFVKKDGTARTMLATRDPVYLPPQPVLTEEQLAEKMAKPKKAESPDTFKLYDVEAKGWRSLTLENLVSVGGRYLKQIID